MSWKISKQMFFDLPHFPAASELVTWLVHSCAIEGSGFLKRVEAKHHAVLHVLLAGGHAPCDVYVGVMLFAPSLLQLQMKWRVHDPDMVCRIRDDDSIAWDDRTKLELVLMLEAKGGVGKQYPPSRRTALQGYAAGHEKVWCTSVRPPFAAYLQAFLRMEELC